MKDGGMSFYTFDLRRPYKDEADKWHETTSLTGDDAEIPS